MFFESKKINGATAANFKIIGKGYSKDLYAIYFEASPLASADVVTFELFKDNETSAEEFNYAKDKFSVFVNDKKISEADVASFKILALGYATDNKHVFYKNAVVKDAQIATFKTYPHAFGDEDAKDASNKYLAGKRVSANRTSGPALPHQK